MRIAVGQFWQETNTFNRNLTRWSDFEAMGVARGSDIVERYGRTGELSGFLAEFRARQPEAEFVGLARFGCWPAGSIATDTWADICAAFRDELRKAGPVDAVYLTLHGALRSQDEPDATGRLIALIREEVGPHVPVVGSLDLHANITPLMTESADVLAGYHTCPHVDGVETGARAARALDWCLTHRRRPLTLTIKLPMITAAELHNTFTGPPARLYQKLKTLEADPAVLSAGLYMAMPWFDAPNLGWTVTLIVADDSNRWRTVISELADEAWSLRHALEAVDRYAPRDVVDRALAIVGRPVVIGDGADATNSGATGDSTALLSAFLSRPSADFAADPGIADGDALNGGLTFMVDPLAVRAAQAAGAGGVFDAEIGGRLAPEFSSPIRVRGVVERLVDVKWILDGHIAKNLPIDMGAGAVVRSGAVTVLFCERSGPGSSPRLYESAGLDPRRFKLVVAKSPAGFRADYEPFAAGILLADCPGPASPHWDQMPFYEVNRPLWPLDPVGHPSEVAWCRDLS